MGFTLGGRRYSGWEAEEDMCATKEQARRELAEGELGFTLVELDGRVSNNTPFDPARAK